MPGARWRFRHSQPPSVVGPAGLSVLSSVVVVLEE